MILKKMHLLKDSSVASSWMIIYGGTSKPVIHISNDTTLVYLISKISILETQEYYHEELTDAEVEFYLKNKLLMGVDSDFTRINVWLN